MKNVLQYYYGLTPINLRQKNKNYFFEISKIKYVFLQCNRNIKEITDIYNLSNSLNRRSIPSHQIILNSNKEIVTYINNVPYILMRIFIKEDELLILNDIIHFEKNAIVSKDYLSLNRNDWYQLWINKIDYFEYQVKQLSKKYPVIQESFAYFVGLAENAISLYRMIHINDNNQFVISHKRVNSKDTLFDFYNPLNYIIDNKVRDASEYFKSLFLSDQEIFNEIIYYFKYSSINDYEARMFFIRMMFPTFYFDVYEDVITGTYKEKELQKIVILSEKYNLLLRQLYQYLKYKIGMPEIEWLN